MGMVTEYPARAYVNNSDDIGLRSGLRIPQPITLHQGNSKNSSGIKLATFPRLRLLIPNRMLEEDRLLKTYSDAKGTN